jgi:hypothetical protein
MKKILCLITLLAASAFGQPETLTPLVCSGVTTSTVPVTATSQTLSAYINALKIVVTPAATTCTVSVATSSETLYSATGVNGTMPILRPVVQGDTNGTAVAAFSKAFLASDALTVSAHTATAVTNITVTVTPIIERNP